MTAAVLAASIRLAPFRLDGRVAVVTGASSGLGERFARVLDAVGARVVVTARRADRLEALAATMTDAVVVAADLSAPDDRERLVATTLEVGGRLDVLVNNAGVGVAMALEDETLDWFRTVMEVNVTAAWHLAKLARAGADRRRRGLDRERGVDARATSGRRR